MNMREIAKEIIEIKFLYKDTLIMSDAIDYIVERYKEILNELETAKIFIKTNFGKNGKIVEIIIEEKDLTAMLIKIFKTYGIGE